MPTKRMRQITHNPLFGLLLLFVCTWPIDLALLAQAHGLLPVRVPELLGLFVGCGFVVASILASALDGGLSAVRALLRRFLVWRVGAGWHALALCGTAAVALCALAIDWRLGMTAQSLAQPVMRDPVVRNFVPQGVAMWVVVPGWFLFEVLTNGEEIGWRGYLLPRLSGRFGARRAALLTGVVWAAWHAPKLLLAGTVGAPAAPFWLHALHTTAFSVLIAWVFQHTQGSLLIATLFHAANNTALICLPIPAGGRAFTLMVGLTCLWALGVLLVTRPDLMRRRRAPAGLRSLAPHTTGAMPAQTEV